jgi:hypothetical protein
MGKFGWALVLGLALGGMLAVPGRAQTCPRTLPINASTDQRLYQDARLGFSFAIPANYRAMGTSLGTVEFYDPGTFEVVQCLAKTRPLARRPLGTRLEVRALPVPALDLMTTIQQTLPWLVLYKPDYQTMTFGSVEGVLYHYRHTLYQTEITGLVWLSPDQRSLITLEGPADSPVIRFAATTLQQ